MAIDGTADVGGVGQHAVDRGGVPAHRAPVCRAAGVLQAAADLAQAQPLQPDPGEDLPDRGRLLGDNLEAGHAATLILGDVAVAERRGGERAEQAGARRMAAPAPTAFQNLGALVLGDHPLDLQQQVVLGRAGDRAVEEDDLSAGAPELLHQQHLVGMAASQPVGGMDIETIDAAGRHGIAQPLQRRAQQAGAAVALVDIGVIGLELATIGGDALAQRGDLAGDGVIARLLLGRHTRVESDLSHAYLRAGLPSPPAVDGRARLGARSCAGSAPGGCRRRSGTAGRTGWSRTIPAPPGVGDPCVGPWAPPSAVAPDLGLRLGGNRPWLHSASRRIMADHSKCGLARLYERSTYRTVSWLTTMP